MIKVTEVDILIAALTIHGEDRGGTQRGRTAIAFTIINRAKAKAWWSKGVEPYPDHSLAAVCLKPWQFSCWNEKDPNRKLLIELQDQYRKAIRQKSCRAALKALIDALDGYVEDETFGATHYLTTELHLSGRAPEWSRRDDYVEIGGHRFFSGVK